MQVASRTWRILRVLGSISYMVLLFPTTVSALADVPEYTAVLGGIAELPCNITVPGNDDAISLILWYKGHSGPPFYSVDARNANIITKAKHFLNKLLNNRGYFEASGNSAILRLNSVQENDAGYYRCRVDYRHARTHSTVSRLSVIVPPKEVLISDTSKKKLSGVTGPYNQAEPLRLTCEAFGGIPPPAVTWWRDGKLLDDTYEATEQGSVKNDFIFSHLHRKDLMTTMDCQASNNNETTPTSLSVTIDLNLKPLDVKITSRRQPLISGDRSEFVCESYGARPKARISWRKGGTEIHKVKEETSIDSNLTTSTLTFIPRKEDDGQYLSCRADNPILPSSLLEDGYIMKVHYAPQMSLAAIDGQSKSTVREGTSIRLFCNISSNPSIVDIAWFFNKKPMFGNVNAGRVVQNQTLVLENVTRRDRGRYHCTANNIVGKGESNDFVLVVLFAPVCKPALKVVFGAARGETVKVTCEVESDPPENTFAWKFNNTVLERDIITVSSYKHRSVASYTPKSMNDFGNMYCWAQNSVGRQRTPCTFSILPAGPPDRLESCFVTNFTTETITVECQPGDNNGLPPSYFMELYNKEKLERNVSRPDFPNFHIDGLPPGTQFSIVLYAANVKGRSDPFTLATATKPAAQKQVGKDTNTGLSPLLGIITGVILALVVGAVIIVVVLRYRRQQKQTDNWNQDQEWYPVRCVKATQKYYDNLNSNDRRYHEVEMNVYHDSQEIPSEEESHHRLYVEQPGFQTHHLPYQDRDEIQWPETLVDSERRYRGRGADVTNAPCSSYYDEMEVPPWPSHDVRIKSTMI